MDESTTTATGGCLCGAVRFAARGFASPLTACHCLTCQRWGGGPYLSVSVEPDAVAWTGGPVSTYASSEWAERGFCPACGTHLFFRLTPSGAYDLPLGLFDADPGLPLALEIYCDRASPAYAFAGARERLTEAESVARWAGETGA